MTLVKRQLQGSPFFAPVSAVPPGDGVHPSIAVHRRPVLPVLSGEQSCRWLPYLWPLQTPKLIDLITVQSPASTSNYGFHCVQQPISIPSLTKWVHV